MFKHKSSKNRPKVLHIATGNYSPRVIQKEVSSLVDDYDVYVLQSVVLNDTEEKAHIFSLKYFPQLWKRVLWNLPAIIYHYIRIRPQIVHLHVSELLPIGYFFSIFNTKIIFDVYEDMHKKLPFKEQHNNRIFKFIFLFFDKIARKHFYLIFAEKTYLTSYPNLSKPYTVLLNYPCLEKFSSIHFKFKTEQPEILYIGQISYQRAFDTIFKTLYLLKKQYPFIRLKLFGYFSTPDFSKKYDNYLSTLNLTNNVDYYGMMAFEEAAKIAQNASVGLALLKDIGDYSISYPTKMFEYMAAGLPLITSNFQHCLSVINSSKCGFGIVPDDEIVLAEKISWLIENQKEAIKMGEKGRKAVFQRYNWASEEQKLLAFYKVVLSN